MRYQLEKQKTDYYCFPACLQAVLRNYQIFLTQEEIAREINCNEEGANLKDIAKFLEARKFDFEFYDYNKTDFNEPDFLLSEAQREGKHVLIAYPNEKGKHVCLLEEFSDPKLTIINPKDAGEYDTNIYSLMEKMFKAKKGGFGLISKL